MRVERVRNVRQLGETGGPYVGSARGVGAPLWGLNRFRVLPIPRRLTKSDVYVSSVPEITATLSAFMSALKRSQNIGSTGPTTNRLRCLPTSSSKKELDTISDWVPNLIPSRVNRFERVLWSVTSLRRRTRPARAARAAPAEADGRKDAERLPRLTPLVRTLNPRRSPMCYPKCKTLGTPLKNASSSSRS